MTTACPSTTACAHLACEECFDHPVSVRCSGGGNGEEFCLGLIQVLAQEPVTIPHMTRARALKRVVKLLRARTEMHDARRWKSAKRAEKARKG